MNTNKIDQDHTRKSQLKQLLPETETDIANFDSLSQDHR